MCGIIAWTKNCGPILLWPRVWGLLRWNARARWSRAVACNPTQKITPQIGDVIGNWDLETHNHTMWEKLNQCTSLQHMPHTIICVFLVEQDYRTHNLWRCWCMVSSMLDIPVEWDFEWRHMDARSSINMHRSLSLLPPRWTTSFFWILGVMVEHNFIVEHYFSELVIRPIWTCLHWRSCPEFGGTQRSITRPWLQEWSSQQITDKKCTTHQIATMWATQLYWFMPIEAQLQRTIIQCANCVQHV